MYLKAGESYTVEDLLYGLLLVSGNDAASALALHVADSMEEFAELMNAKAAELGMTERAVEGRLYRLKKRLRTMLGGDGDA